MTYRNLLESVQASIEFNHSHRYYACEGFDFHDASVWLASEGFEVDDFISETGRHGEMLIDVWGWVDGDESNTWRVVIVIDESDSDDYGPADDSERWGCE